jgi:hypothetical protein
MLNASQIIAELHAIKMGIVAAHDKPDLVEELTKHFFYFAGSIKNEDLANTVKLHMDFPSLCEFYSNHYAHHFHQKELNQAQQLLAGTKYLDSVPEAHVQHYDQDANELKFVSRANRQHDFVVVGCGLFPETLMRCYKTEDFSRFIGIDIDTEITEMAANVFSAYMPLQPKKSVLFTATYGQEYNYSQASVIFIANSVKNKQAIIERAVATMPDDAIILARSSQRLCSLVFEDIYEQGSIAGIKEKASVATGTMSKTYMLMKACQ